MDINPTTLSNNWNASASGVANTTPRAERKTPVAAPSFAAPRANDVKAPPPPTRTAVQQAVDHANAVLVSKKASDVQFSIDKDTDLQVVKLVDRTSGETIMQMPSAEMLKIAKSIDQFVGGLIQKTA